MRIGAFMQTPTSLHVVTFFLKLWLSLLITNLKIIWECSCGYFNGITFSDVLFVQCLHRNN
jgi:hypothetical protein